MRLSAHCVVLTVCLIIINSWQQADAMPPPSSQSTTTTPAPSTTTPAPSGRRRRDASAIESGHNWFKSFYSLFTDLDSKKAPMSKLGITPSSSKPPKPKGGKSADPMHAAQQPQEEPAIPVSKPVSKPLTAPVRPKLVVGNFFPDTAETVIDIGGDDATDIMNDLLLATDEDVSVVDVSDDTETDSKEGWAAYTLKPTASSATAAPATPSTVRSATTKESTTSVPLSAYDTISNDLYKGQGSSPGYPANQAGFQDYASMYNNMNYHPTYEYNPYTGQYYATQQADPSLFYNDYQNQQSYSAVTPDKQTWNQNLYNYDQAAYNLNNLAVDPHQAQQQQLLDPWYQAQQQQVNSGHQSQQAQQQQVNQAQQQQVNSGHQSQQAQQQQVNQAQQQQVNQAQQQQVNQAQQQQVNSGHQSQQVQQQQVNQAQQQQVNTGYQQQQQQVNSGYPVQQQQLNSGYEAQQELVDPSYEAYGQQDLQSSGAGVFTYATEEMERGAGLLSSNSSNIAEQPDMSDLGLDLAIPDLSTYNGILIDSPDKKIPLEPVIKNVKTLPPNKKPDAGIPNKKPMEIIDYDHEPLGFSLVGPDFRLPKEECLTESGKVGECLQAFECGLENGVIDGLCHMGHDAYYHLRTCCIYESHCGYETNKEVTYLKNPEFPHRTQGSSTCMFKIDLLPTVCQLRLDFLELEMKGMKDGECDPANSLSITSSSPEAFIPVKQFCGTIHREVEDELRTDLPHIYVHVDRDHPSLKGNTNSGLPNKNEEPSVWLNLKVKDFASRWNIRVSQIQCDGANLQAPAGCGQYYNMNSGNLTSLNYLDQAYPKGVSLTSCIKRDPSACALELNMKSFAVGETKFGASTKLGYGLTCKDYFLVNGEKTSICGTNNNIPRRMIFPANGPESVHFYSDDLHNPKTDVGYHFEYFHHTNCRGLEFYKYPNKK